MLVALVVWFGRWVRVPPDPISRVVAVALLLLAVLWPLTFLVRTARRSLRLGLSFDDVRSAAVLEARVLAEESRAVYGGHYSGDLSRSREDWLRLLAGPVGRFIFAFAGVGLHLHSAAPRPDSQPADLFAAVDDDRPAAVIEGDEGAGLVAKRRVARLRAGRDAAVRGGAERALVELELPPVRARALAKTGEQPDDHPHGRSVD